MTNNLRSRVNKLEAAQGIGRRMKYMCVLMQGWADGWDTPEEKAKGYKIQPFIQSAGGTGGEPFYIRTEQGLNEFAARDDVELTIIKIGREDKNNPV